MDESIERLARAAASDPSDEAAARRLDGALARAGRGAEAAERFRLKFQCSRQWVDLRATPRAGVKHCEGCDRDVHAVHDLPALREQVARGSCVAFPSTLLGHVFSGLATDARLTSASGARPPCVVPGGAIPPEGTARWDDAPPFPRRLAEQAGIAPIGLRGEKLVVAVAREDAQALRLIRDVVLRDLETVLVTEEEVARLIDTMPISFTMDPGIDFMGDVAVDVEPRDAREDAWRLTAEGRALALRGDAAGSRRALEEAIRTDPGYRYARLWVVALFGEDEALSGGAGGDSWPGPLERCLLGEITEVELIASVERGEDAESRRQQLCEAFGFLGAARETWGVAGAREMYERCVRQGVTNFVEHEFALQRLSDGGAAPWV